MPVGQYPTFQDCVTAMQKKGKSKDSAGAICGAMEKQSQGSVQVASSSNDKFYVKAFLLDGSLNINKWRVTPESIDKNINSFIGKPLVLTETFDHPSPNTEENLAHWLAFQETFRVGTIIDITTRKNPATGNPGYYAVIEVTNEDLKQSLRDNKVPLYVSPAIAELIAPKPNQIQNAALRLPDGSELVDNWVGVHLAIVSEPAFGVKKAVISETCGGDEKGCLLQLRKASIAKFGVGKCGFCVKKALNTYAILQQLPSYRSHSAAVNSSNVSDTSHPTNQATHGRKMSTLETNDPSTGNAGSTEQVVEKVEQRSIPLQQQPPQETSKQPVHVQSPGAFSIPDLLQKIQQLEQSNQLKDVKIEELSSVNNTFGERVASLEMERRREKIERILTSEVIKDQKARLEKINYFTASSIPIEEIEALYRDVKIAMRKASVAPTRGRVPYFGSNMGTSGVASPGTRPDVFAISDDESGLTPLQKQMAVLRGGP